VASASSSDFDACVLVRLHEHRALVDPVSVGGHDEQVGARGQLLDAELSSVPETE
jgi:hypothetical protein